LVVHIAQEEALPEIIVRYLNRLSDLLFILCRHVNRATGDVLWTPGGGRSSRPAGT
jgi:cob(I)alamin adenosyltransferase